MNPIKIEYNEVKLKVFEYEEYECRVSEDGEEEEHSKVQRRRGQDAFNACESLRRKKLEINFKFLPKQESKAVQRKMDLPLIP